MSAVPRWIVQGPAERVMASPAAEVLELEED
jgi:hypothetical protein